MRNNVCIVLGVSAVKRVWQTTATIPCGSLHCSRSTILPCCTQLQQAVRKSVAAYLLLRSCQLSAVIIAQDTCCQACTHHKLLQCNLQQADSVHIPLQHMCAINLFHKRDSRMSLRRCVCLCTSAVQLNDCTTAYAHKALASTDCWSAGITLASFSRVAHVRAAVADDLLHAGGLHQEPDIPSALRSASRRT